MSWLSGEVSFLCLHGSASRDCPECVAAEVLEEDSGLKLHTPVYRHRTGVEVRPAPCCEAMGPPRPRK